MRITIVSRIFAPEPGAASFRLGALARACAEAGNSVCVLTSAPPSQLNAGLIEFPDNVQIKRAKVLRDRAGYVRGYAQYMSFDIPLMARLLFARRPDIVLAEPPPTTGAVVRLICAMRRVPYAYYAADIWSDASQTAGAPSFVVKIVRWLEKFAMRGAQRVLSVSDGVSERLRELSVSRNVRTIGNGSDLAAFSLEGPAKNLRRPYFVYTGTASEVHGARIFADAFADVQRVRPDAALVFVGQGSEFPVIKEIAADLPEGSISVFPRTTPSEVARWLRGAAAALASVKPDSGYDFAFPTKMYAATSCGTPVIYAGTGPGKAFIDTIGYGIATDYDVESVATSMISMLEREQARADRQRASAWARENVDIGAIATSACNILESVASEHQKKLTKQ
ncbi:glycosyltransferase family 4 protein [Paramicrobacterium agarici]|uniref:D-inositol 3-phosphate glycosyltransferase n=1 Tax=Paramicrobacterium agarici TaxID=630514 RepID=A0A2A9E102_9MICO|nr:glycosyltransferase family 4 protein [Microbacterium agarici]PFG31892.1 glycosyltransferase involved in cell wall biosynthesis [Microbacterium agarici]